MYMQKELREEFIKEICRGGGSVNIFDICDKLDIQKEIQETEVAYILVTLAAEIVKKSSQIADFKTITRDDIVTNTSLLITKYQEKIEKEFLQDNFDQASKYTKILNTLIETYTNLEGFNAAKKIDLQTGEELDLSLLTEAEMKLYIELTNKMKKKPIEK